MLIHLILAGTWFGVGMGLIIWHALHPEENTLRILGTSWSAGWIGILLALYNIARWWSFRSRPIDSASRLPPPLHREPLHEEFRFDDPVDRKD